MEWYACVGGWGGKGGAGPLFVQACITWRGTHAAHLIPTNTPCAALPWHSVVARLTKGELDGRGSYEFTDAGSCPDGVCPFYQTVLTQGGTSKGSSGASMVHEGARGGIDGIWGKGAVRVPPSCLAGLPCPKLGINF